MTEVADVSLLPVPANSGTAKTTTAASGGSSNEKTVQRCHYIAGDRGVPLPWRHTRPRAGVGGATWQDRYPRPPYGSPRQKGVPERRRTSFAFPGLFWPQLGCFLRLPDRA